MTETTSGEFPVTWEHPSDPALSWEFDDMHTPYALAPLAGDYTRLIADGITYRFQHFGLPMRFHCRIINNYAYFADELLVPESDRPGLRAQSVAQRRAQARRVRRFWDEEVYPGLAETYAWMRAAPVEAAPLDQVAALWEEVWQRLRRLWGLHFLTNAGSYQSVNDLADRYESLFPGAGPDEALRLIQGLPGDLQRVQRDLFLLAERARSHPAVAAAIVGDSAGVPAALPGIEGAAAFFQALHSFIEAHGHLGQAFDDLTLPSWADEPALLLAEVRKRLLTTEGDPERTRQRLAAEAEALAAQTRARLRDRPEDLRRFEETLALAQEAGPLTEGHNYRLDRMLQAHARGLALRVGRRLVAAGVATAADDVFFLRAHEIGDALRHPRDLRALVAARRADLELWRQIRPPRRLGKLPESPPPPDRFEPPPPEQTEDRVLRGTGACAGTGRGPARVVLSAADFASVQPGDVLVCPSSNPSWVPLFGIIAGLVTNTGGVLSHAAVVAREFGVPAVVGTGVATERLRDGQLVEVDGTAGEVRVLE